MPRHVDGDLEKVTLRLYDGDFSRVQQYYPVIGANEAIRKIIRSHLKKLDEQMSQKESADGTKPEVTV